MGILISVLSGLIVALIVPRVHRPGREITGWLLAAVPVSITAYLAAYMPAVAGGEVFHYSYAWLPQLGVHLAFYVDGLSLFFALIVSAVGALIFIYSAGYIREHPQGGRFYAYMLMFMASMLGLVLANNLLTLYVFFELTTIASFLLIAFEHREREARRSARQALLITNTGGLSLLAAFLLIGQVTGTYEISALLEMGADVRASTLYVPILLLVLVAAFTKSAQFPFYAWLPNAMVAPTPVSAYLHSAAMVKAGIYLLARFAPVLGDTAAWHIIVTAVGASTTVLGGWLALRYTDLKRILAYSTIMALGLLTMLLGIGSEEAIKACILFVLVHAAYKGALFMVAGTIDHTTGKRSVTQVRGLGSVMPWSFTAALAAGASMAGLPPFIGFIGKETAYAAAMHAPTASVLIGAAVAANVALVAAAGVVALRPFLGAERRPEAVHSPSTALWLPALVLAGLGLAAGVAPRLIESTFIAPAVRSVVRQEVSVHLSLWHGFTPELGLSVLTVAAGIAAYLLWDRLRTSRPMRTFAAGIGEGLDYMYRYTEYGVLRAARGQTAILQHGILRYYLTAIFVTTVLLVGFPLLGQLQFVRLPAWGEIRLYETAIACMIVVAMGAALYIRSRLGTIVTLSTASFCITLIYIFFGAPDLALTRLLIESFTAILVVLAFIDLPDVHPEARFQSQLRSGTVALLVGAVMSVLMLAVLDLPFDNHLGRYFIEHSVPEAHGHNIVNTILVDFRALDTLGEITVLATAGVSIYALIEMRRTTIHRNGHIPRPPERESSRPETT